MLVAGAWLGAWCWVSVARVLAAAGARVEAVDLGAGDGDTTAFGRQVAAVHDASARAGGAVVLVGHSHGGSVVTAAAPRTPSGAGLVIFLDGAMPQSGMSTADTWPPGMRDELAARVGADGMLPPPSRAELPDIPAADFGRLRPCPWPALITPVRDGAESLSSPVAFIRTSGPGSMYEEARADVASRGGYTGVVPGGHYAMFTNPSGTARALVRAAGTMMGVT